MTFRTTTIILATFIVLIMQTASCRQEGDDRWVSVGGPQTRASLVIFFKKESTNEQIADFYEQVVNLDSEPLALRFIVYKNDLEGVAVNFSNEATMEQRLRITSRARESPIVYKVYENAVPAEIADL